MMGITDQKGDLIISGILCALGIFVILQARAMPYGEATVPGPGFLPMILGVLLLGVSLILGIKALLYRGNTACVQLGHRSMVSILVALVLLAGLLERAGFLPVMTLFVFLSLKTLSRLKWWMCLLWGLLAAFAAYGFFSLLLGIPLPSGTWWY
jgi:putative tricarboxylic transport membrane protein